MKRQWYSRALALRRAGNITSGRFSIGGNFKGALMCIFGAPCKNFGGHVPPPAPPQVSRPPYAFGHTSFDSYSNLIPLFSSQLALVHDGLSRNIQGCTVYYNIVIIV